MRDWYTSLLYTHNVASGQICPQVLTPQDPVVPPIYTFFSVSNMVWTLSTNRFCYPTLCNSGQSPPPQEGVERTVFVCALHRVKRVTVSGASKAKLAMQVEKCAFSHCQMFVPNGAEGLKSAPVGFLGDVHASGEPLHPADIYKKHQVFGVLYQNWNPATLKDGDVLVVRNNQSFFTTLTAGSNSHGDVEGLMTMVDYEEGIEMESEDSSQCLDTIVDTGKSFRARALQFFRDPNSSRCD